MAEKCPGSKRTTPGLTTLSLLQPLDTGLKSTKLGAESSHQEDMSTGLKTHKTKIQKRKSSSTQESAPKSKKPTSKDKKNTLETSIPKQSVITISVQDSTIRERTLKPFFNSSSKVLSEKLWLPIETDLAVCHLTSSNGSLLNSGQSLQVWTTKSMKKVKQMSSQMTSWRLSQSSQLDTMAPENTRNLKPKESKIIKSVKIPICLSEQLKEYCRLCFLAYDTYYNLSIAKINEIYENKKQEFTSKTSCIHENCTKPKQDNSFFCEAHKDKKTEWNLNISMISIRKLLTIANRDLELLDDSNPLKEFIKVPYDLRNEAIDSAVNAYKISVKLLTLGHIKEFNLKPRKINYFNTSKIFQLPSNFIKLNDNGLMFCKTNYQAIYGKTSIPLITLSKRNYQIIKKLELSTFKISKDKTGKYFLIIPKTIDKREDIQNRKPIISLDPGVRTFHTGYDPTGLILESGSLIKPKLDNICNKIAVIDEKINSKPPSKSKRKLIKHKAKRHQKMKNIVENMHNQLASYLTKNYNSIVVPQLPVKKLVRKAKETCDDQASSHEVKRRNINSKTSNILVNLSFYRFIEKLKGLCDFRKVILHIVDESYTSKTCGRCGFIKDNLGGNKVYKCDECSLEIGRDHNGARNILLKNMTC
jgi:putative transposase